MYRTRTTYYDYIIIVAMCLCIWQVRVSGLDVDLLQQALTNSGLTNGNVATSSGSVQPSQSVALSQSASVNKDTAAGVTRGSSVEEPSSSLAASVSKTSRRLSVVSTMAVHDSVTGTIRRHPVRKVLTAYSIPSTSSCCRAACEQ